MDDAAMRAHLLEDDRVVRRLARGLRRVTVLGIKPESRRTEAGFYVPEYLEAAGVEVVPVPVYYPEVEEILGRRVYRRLADVPQPIELLDVFRRPEHLEAHLPDILAARPRAVWLQSGIRHDAFAERLARAGIDVVQDRCLLVEHRRATRGD